MESVQFFDDIHTINQPHANTGVFEWWSLFLLPQAKLKTTISIACHARWASLSNPQTKSSMKLMCPPVSLKISLQFSNSTRPLPVCVFSGPTASAPRSTFAAFGRWKSSLQCTYTSSKPYAIQIVLEATSTLHVRIQERQESVQSTHTQLYVIMLAASSFDFKTALALQFCLCLRFCMTCPNQRRQRHC